MPGNLHILPDRIVINLEARDKSAVLDALANRASAVCGVEASLIALKLFEREEHGSTGIGNGIAIPHCRLPEMQNVCAFFAHLKTPVDFDAADGKPVDLIFLLLSPLNGSTEHLKDLSRISRMMRDETTRSNLRECKTPEDAYNILIAYQ